MRPFTGATMADRAALTPRGRLQRPSRRSRPTLRLDHAAISLVAVNLILMKDLSFHPFANWHRLRDQ